MRMLFVFILSICILLSGCLQEEHPFLAFNGNSPQNINDGWVISSPMEEGVDEVALSNIYQEIYDNGDLWQLRSLLVFRNGKLISESYLKNPNDMYNPRPIWSCTKQIVGVLTGLAYEQGYIGSPDDPISDYLSQELQNHRDKSNITIENLLTMRSGIGFDETVDVSEILQKTPDNTIDYILDIPLIFTPGETFYYNSGDTHLIAASIQNSLGYPLEDWADEVLFSKIGFENYTWLEYDGYNYGGFGISTTPRNLARIAQLVLDGGAWNDTQLVDSLWIDDMITTQTVIGNNSSNTFGYQWWINPDEGIYFMAGSGGQYACIVPDKNLIVVVMSEHDTDDELELDFETMLELVDKIRNTAN